LLARRHPGKQDACPTRKQDVGGLEVAVQDAVLVGVMHRPRHRRQQAGRRTRVFLQTRRVLAEVAALDELHGEVRPAVLFADFVDGHDVGQPRPGCSRSFLDRR
jgi:hypothetical protein